MMAMICVYIFFFAPLALLMACVFTFGYYYFGKFAWILGIAALLLYLRWCRSYTEGIVYLVDKIFPVYPPCETGCCRRVKDYTVEDRGCTMNRERPHWSILTCKCGHKYSYIETWHSGHQVLKIESDDNEVPYMKLSWLARWVEDK